MTPRLQAANGAHLMAAEAASTVAMVTKPKPRQGPMLLPMARASRTCG